MDSENQSRQENNENQYNVTAHWTVLKDYELIWCDCGTILIKISKLSFCGDIFMA